MKSRTQKRRLVPASQTPPAPVPDLAAFDKLPPHSIEAEQGILGCWLLSPPEVGDLCESKGVCNAWFYDERHCRIFQTLQAMHLERRPQDILTVHQRLKDQNQLEGAGGLEYLSGLQDAVPSAANLGYYVEIVREKWQLRKAMAAASSIISRIHTSQGANAGKLLEEFAESVEFAKKGTGGKPPGLSFVKLSEHVKYQPVENLCLVGDSDITKGYQGVAVFAGPPGSGKSLAAVSLAIAGAIGFGEWMGRPVHRNFRTLVIQCENGAGRLKREFSAMAENYPSLDFDAWIRISLPPEGGLPFHRPEFRRELARQVEEFKPDVVIVDPWTAVAADDAAKDIIEKLAEMRSCLPPGDECPALVIVAHTKKPRAEDRGSRGRALMYSVSGSQALVATARSVFVLLPFTDDIQDDRVLWACSKLSDSDSPPADTVWHRRLGRLFDPCDADPEEFWKDPADRPSMWLKVEMLQEVLTVPAAASMTQNRLAETLAERFNDGRGASSVHKWLKRPEFSSHLSVQAGLISWKD